MSSPCPACGADVEWEEAERRGTVDVYEAECPSCGGVGLFSVECDRPDNVVEVVLIDG